jgi:prepilin-type N-terminal cleavage/methylation domain-containing protein
MNARRVLLARFIMLLSSNRTVARRPRGFTLIELLVVIGIITILIGVLLPTLSRSRKAARRTSVLSALHQIGVGVAAYQVEFRGWLPRDQPEGVEGRAFCGLALLAQRYKLPAALFINPNTNDTPATRTNADGWPVLIELDGAEVTQTAPATIDASNIARVQWHCSYAYDSDRKQFARKTAPRVYVGDRADYTRGRSFSANWDREGMCLLFTDQHAEYVQSKAVPEQSDPNVYRHNQYYDENGVHPGEGGDEVFRDVSVTPDTRDSHLRVFSEEEDDALLPNP